MQANELTRDQLNKFYTALKPAPENKKCPRCGGPLFLSNIPEYTYQCFTCDEDFYNIEVK